MRRKTFGGHLTENIVQAISRDVMIEAMRRFEKSIYKPILTVHDEIIGEVKKGQGSVEEFCQIMKERPTWAKDFPIDAEGWRGPRYKK
jgi:DNA polymerase